ncbi:uncharacterized protein C8Q71DRAFT_700341 [Rhodofomes roseus]|uniref:Uncharacterized protein n=1 Tax=Rhodofomes roseus TaxID=34475 RepID=A0ABQ8KV00_9APHY|nr:uncharacterized protein C8Q71DRAFT_700341 [Rhodofomes roseus]KAH9841858.1 hypothetical protein C8Q71DRAFT_700341 [Rhodofomes roseus]
MAQPVIYSTPPLAGRPPYATDEPDSVYQQQPQQTRRIRQPPPENPNDRSSAYNIMIRRPSRSECTVSNVLPESMDVRALVRLPLDSWPLPLPSIATMSRCTPCRVSSGDSGASRWRYDQYLNGTNAPKGTNPFDDPKRVLSPPRQPIPLAAPRPGYAAPVAALNLSRPDAVASPDSRVRSPTTPEMSQAFPKPLTLVERQSSPASPHFPHTPHELQPPMTPIAPAFIRPASAASTQRDVKFNSTTPILRSEKEETFLPRRGQGEDFWRRFSIVAKDETKTRGKQRKTTSGISRHVRWVWVVGISLLIIIGCAVAFGVYKTHHSSSSSNSSVVTAIGGSANQVGSGNTVTADEKSGGSASALLVTPTRTVARRSVDIQPTSAPAIPITPPSFPILPNADADEGSDMPSYDNTNASVAARRALSQLHHRHKRSFVNRSSLD